MPQSNKLSGAISPADKQAVLQQLATIRQQLSPVLLFNLTPDDRVGMAKMGDKSLAFVQKALDYAQKNSALVPTYLDVTEATKDLALVTDLREIAHELKTLCQAIEDTLTMAGAEAYEASLIFHASVKGASRNNAAGSQAIYEDLVQRFPRAGRKQAAATSALVACRRVTPGCRSF